MATVVLTNEEKARIRYHLGYPQTDPVTSIQLGLPRASQTAYVVEGQMDRIPDHAIAIIRNIVAILDGIDARLIDALDRLAAKSTSDLDLNPEECDKLRKEYAAWALTLADNLGAPINRFASKFQSGGMPINIPVIH